MVYLIMRSVNNGVDCWTDVHDVYKDETEAELKAIELNDSLGEEFSNTSFYVEEWEVVGA